jgi:hypothetical protein
VASAGVGIVWTLIAPAAAFGVAGVLMTAGAAGILILSGRIGR